VIARNTAVCSVFSEGLRPGRAACSLCAFFTICRLVSVCLNLSITCEVFFSFTPSEQLAAVTGFVALLNRDCNLHLRAEMDPKRSAGAKKRRLEQVLIKMMQKSHRDSDDMKEWLRVALECFHGVRLRRGDAVNWKETDGWAEINVAEHSYQVPLP